MAILLKACPRCGVGDVELPRSKDDDPNCIQCGFEVNPNSVARIRLIKKGLLVLPKNDNFEDDTSGEY